MANAEGTQDMSVEKTITRGNLWSIAASIATSILAAGSVIVYVTIKLTVVESATLANAESSRLQRDAIALQEVRLRGLEQDVVRQEERYINMMTTLDRVDARTQRIEHAMQEDRRSTSP